MKNPFLLFLTLFLGLLSSVYGLDNETFIEKADVFFKQNITSNGMVDYAKVKDDRTLLDQLLDHIHTADLSGFSDEERKAFYINAYNLLVIGAIVADYPVASPMKIPSFFDGKKHLVAGSKMTLNDLENKKLRAEYNDARIHFVLVCAAISCPKIASFAYNAADLDRQLDERTRLALNDDQFIEDTPKKNLISEIFKWYRADFAKNDDGIIQYINQYRDEPLNADKKLGYYTYDWTLNDFKK